MSTPPKLAPRFTPAFAADMPQSIATHFRQLYLAIGDHNDAITVLNSKASTSTTIVRTVSTGGSSGTVIIPGNTPAILHEAIVSYDASTGMFGQLQFDFTDLTGVATPAQIGTGSPSAGEYVDGGTGAWTALPGGITHVVPLGPLTTLGAPGSITVVNGRITASVDPT